jgi:hypothetical protein
VSCSGRRVLLGLSGDAMVLLGEWPQTSAGAGRKGAAPKEVAP